MGRSDGGEGRCKRHPRHLQSTGVCPFCLKEKLSCLSSSSSCYSHASSSTASVCTPYSPDDSALCSLASSPTHHHINSTGFSLLLKEGMDLGGLVGKSEPLAKSRSFVFVVRRQKGDRKEHREVMEKKKEEKEKEKKSKKKRRSFWFKMLSGARRGKKEGYSLLQSETLKEEPASTKWV